MQIHRDKEELFLVMGFKNGEINVYEVNSILNLESGKIEPDNARSNYNAFWLV